MNIPRLATELTHHPDKEFREYLLSGLNYGLNPGVECALSQNHSCNNLQSARAEPDVVKISLGKKSNQASWLDLSMNPPSKSFASAPLA